MTKLNRNNSTVVREKHTENFTVIDNNYLCDDDISIKAVGLLTVMLSINENRWHYSINGLAKIRKDGVAAIRSALKELQDNVRYLRNYSIFKLCVLL